MVFAGLLKLVLVLATAGVLLCVASIVLMARTLLRPRRMTDVRALVRLNRMSPADLGLPYESMAFTVHDEETNGRLTLATWWIPVERSDRTAILIHGYGDAKIGGIAWAPLFRSFGWNVLAVDLRAHGESGGAHTTAGFYERHDIAQVIAELRTREPAKTRSILLFGVSLGGAVALATAELCQREGQDVAGVICDSAFADYPRAVEAHGEILGFPGGILRAGGLWFAQKLSGARFADTRPVDLVKTVRAPLLLILSGDDPFVPASDCALLEASSKQRDTHQQTSVWHVPGCPHIYGYALVSDAYRERVRKFCDEIVGASVSRETKTVLAEASTPAE